MLVTVSMVKREPIVKAHFDEQAWIDIDDLHVELSQKQYVSLMTTMAIAKANAGRTVNDPR
jgi:hypothetical protein